MTKPVIAVDIDDVLAVYATNFISYSNQKWGTNLTVDQYDDHWSRMWGVDLTETEKRANLYVSEGSYRDYDELDHAGVVLRRLSKRYRLIVITSRRQAMRQATLDWIDDHFADIFSHDSVHFAGIWDKLNPSRVKETKADLALSLKADYLIDDQLKHVVAAAGLGIESILFGDYPWSQASQPLPNGVVCKSDWLEVERYFDEH